MTRSLHSTAQGAGIAATKHERAVILSVILGHVTLHVLSLYSDSINRKRCRFAVQNFPCVPLVFACVHRLSLSLALVVIGILTEVPNTSSDHQIAWRPDSDNLLLFDACDSLAAWI